tara:strand:- start:43 stop:519 length:477 start_codon:yes stop_codon:yes gene_type:complete
MEYTSQLYHIVTNPQHPQLEETAYNSELPVYYLKDNTLYKRQGVWQRDWRNWLESVGITVCDENSVYHPVIKVENGVVTTWETQIANIGNKMLDMGESTRQTYFPNLYYVQIGMHPYPKEGRFHKTWRLETAQRESHRIIYPHYDPKQYFLLPKDIDF